MDQPFNSKPFNYCAVFESRSNSEDYIVVFARELDEQKIKDYAEKNRGPLTMVGTIIRENNKDQEAFFEQSLKQIGEESKEKLNYLWGIVKKKHLKLNIIEV